MQVTYTENKLQEVALQLLSNARSKTICFYGEMGSGKTTLIKAIIKNMGSIDTAHSPTYGIVNEYFSAKGKLLAYHFDFYRLNSETEALDLGLEEYFNADVLVLIEWPKMITSLLPESTSDVFLEVLDQNTRKLILKD